MSPERDAVASELAGNVCLGVEQPLAVLAAVLKKTLFIGLKILKYICNINLRHVCMHAVHR